METRFFTSRDMARIRSAHCEGCGACCRGMGDSIVLDPYDICVLSQYLGRSFLEMNQKEIGLHVEQGMVLPHLNMKASDDSCIFLDADGRCSIHDFRPGLCRLFPLGRNYNGTGFEYFVVEDACPKPDRTKVRISQWLAVADLKQYEEAVLRWHNFKRRAQEVLSQTTDADYSAKLNSFFLQVFYVTPYDPPEDFYRLFKLRLEQAETVLN